MKPRAQAAARAAPPDPHSHTASPPLPPTQPPPDPLDSLADDPQELRLRLLRDALGPDFLAAVKATLGELRKRTDPAAAWHAYSMLVQTVDGAHRAMLDLVAQAQAAAPDAGGSETGSQSGSDAGHAPLAGGAGAAVDGRGRPASARDESGGAALGGRRSEKRPVSARAGGASHREHGDKLWTARQVRAFAAAAAPSEGSNESHGGAGARAGKLPVLSQGGGPVHHAALAGEAFLRAHFLDKGAERKGRLAAEALVTRPHGELAGGAPGVVGMPRPPLAKKARPLSAAVPRTGVRVLTPR